MSTLPPLALAAKPDAPACRERIRVRGTVQGVGFRPCVWRIAQTLGVRGSITNDGEGVLIDAWAGSETLREFILRIHTEAPPLARIETIESAYVELAPMPADFRIVASEATHVRTHVAPDAVPCAACAREIFDPYARRFRYPFTNCTHCGPRFSIVLSVPYDRSNTTMAKFPLCASCDAEYHDPRDRRFHAQPLACHACGPRLELMRFDGRPLVLEALTFLDAADAACTLLQRGHVIAIKGLGGYQLACDATRSDAVARLRAGKRRERKPFALMARDLDVIRRCCRVSDAEAGLLQSSAGPIVLLDRVTIVQGRQIAREVAPGIGTLGFMLPNTPLHQLMLRRLDHPIVLTSGNLAEEPQAIERADARARLGGTAEYLLEHDRPIARRVDDSVARIAAGRVRILRRARGYAPAPLAMPAGFERAPRVLACGGQMKNTFCMLRDGEAILSQHIGDLHDALAAADYEKTLADFSEFFQFDPQALACDLHPDYAPTRLACARAEKLRVPLFATQHHHAHIAACMAEAGVPLNAGPLLGVALDGIGFGEDGTLWGGEFMLADYAAYQRVGTFKPVAMPGGDATVREP